MMTNYICQKTIGETIMFSGVGTHSGKHVNLQLKPAPDNYGIRFVRTDLPGKPEIQALFNKVVDTSLATVLGDNGVIVSTIEHLMSSLAAFGIDNVAVELDSYEMPIMDGSAGDFCLKLKKAGYQHQELPKHFFVVKDPIEIEKYGKFVGVYPHDGIKLTCEIEFDTPLIGFQKISLDLSPDQYMQEISRARTFGFYHDYDLLKRFGLARGASLDSAVIINKDKIINESGLRFKDEFVRHKMLDGIGDFSLIGMPIYGHIIMKKSGHAFNHEFIKHFFSQKKSWETTPLSSPTF